MKLIITLVVLAIGIITSVTSQQDPWISNGLNVVADELNTNCAVSGGHTGCGNQQGDVIMAKDKQTRCPALDIFLACIKSECSNANTFQSKIDELEAYCNAASPMAGVVSLISIMTALAFLTTRG